MQHNLKLNTQQDTINNNININNNNKNNQIKKQSQKKGQGLKLHIDKNSHNHEPEEEVVNSKQYYKNSNSQNSKQFNDYSYSGISWSVSTKKCSREMQFDRFQVKNPLRADQKESYFSIFDGHNSDQVSSYLQENLHQLIIQNQKYLSTHDKDQAFKEIFQQMDNDIMGINDLHGGSTALVAIIKQDTLYIVNVGDSQAKMFKTDKSLKAMNRRHIVGDESEKNMLQNKGAVIFDRGNIERINGKLAVSRSFGDKEYKQFISSVPETTTFKLENDDKYLLLASDGLWDCMKDEEVVKLINKFEQDQDLQCKNDNNQKLSLSRYLLDQASDMAGSLTKKDNMTLVIIDIQMLIQEQQNFNIIDKTANNDYSNVIDNQENRQSLSNFDFPQPQNKNNKIQTEIENINKFSQMEIESSGKISMDNINNNQQNNNFCFNNNGSIDSPNKNINNNQNKNINLNINDSIKQNLNSDNGIQEYNQESSKNQSNYQNQDNIHCFQNNKYIDPAIKKINLSQNQENEILSVSKEKSKGNFSFGEGFMTNSNGSENDQNQKQQQQQQDKTKIQEFNTINIQNNISQYNNLNSCNSKSKNNFNFSPVNSNNGENNENIQNQGTSKPKSYFYIETNKFEEEDEDRL